MRFWNRSQETANLTTHERRRMNVQIRLLCDIAGAEKRLGACGRAAVCRDKAGFHVLAANVSSVVLKLPLVTPNGKPANVGTVVAMPAVPGDSTQQWMCEAVVPATRSENVTLTMSTCAAGSKLTTASPTPGDMFTGFSFGPVRWVAVIIGTAWLAVANRPIPAVRIIMTANCLTLVFMSNTSKREESKGRGKLCARPSAASTMRRNHVEFPTPLLVIPCLQGRSTSACVSPMVESVLKKIFKAPAVLLHKTVTTSNGICKKFTNHKHVKKAREYWNILGPGLTTGAADDDPSGIATYSQAGAQYGFQMLWVAGFTYPLMSVVQEMCARIGIVTGRGLAANIREHYPKWALYTCTALLFMANTFNIGADLGAMAQATQLVVPKASFSLLVIGFTVLSLGLQIFLPYQKYANYLKLLTFVLISYIFTAFTIGLDWSQVLYHAVAPSLTISKDQIFLITAVLGTTISPYLFFWQASQEVEEKLIQAKAPAGAQTKTLKKKFGICASMCGRECCYRTR